MREFLIQVLTSDQFIAFLVAGVFAVLGALGKVTINWWNSQKLSLSAQQLDLLHRFAAEAVAVVDQTLKSKTNQEKLEAAIATVRSDLEDYGISLADQDRIRRAVEAAVRRARAAQVLVDGTIAFPPAAPLAVEPTVGAPG